MRVMLTVRMDTERANRAITENTLPGTMRSLMDRVKPEAAYFAAKDGCRTAYVFFDLQRESDIPTFAEPLFQELGADLTIVPVMNFEDVQAGLRAYASG